jgi:hypothetical protein
MIFLIRGRSMKTNGGHRDTSEPPNSACPPDKEFN